MLKHMLTALMSVSCPGLAQGFRTSPVVLAEDSVPELGDVSGKGRGELGESSEVHEAPGAKVRDRWGL